MKLEWETNNGIIQKIFLNDMNVINPWSIEAADSYSAFRHSDKGLRVNTVNTHNATKDISNGEITVKAKEGLWNIEYCDRISKSIIKRNACLITQYDSYLMDFVIRYRFLKKYFDYALINNTKILHNSSNKYYQYQTGKMELVGRKYSCLITMKKQIYKNFYQMMYVSDKKDEWVVHCRLLPKNPAKYVLKLSTFWYDSALPSFIARPFIANSAIRKLLLFRGERKPYQKPLSLLAPNIYPIALLNKNESILIESTCEFRENIK